MRFKFPFEHVLDFRKRAEDAARRDYLETMAKVDDEKKKLNAMFDSLEESGAEVFSLQKTSTNPLARIIYLNSYIDGLKVKIESQRSIIRNLQTIAERKHDILVEAVKEVKIISKLKENRLKEFKKELAKHEAKQIDEMVVTRFKRREEGA